MNTRCKNEGSFLRTKRRTNPDKMLPYEAIAICHNLSDDRDVNQFSDATIMEAINIILDLEDYHNVTRQTLLNAAKFLRERLEHYEE